MVKTKKLELTFFVLKPRKDNFLTLSRGPLGPLKLILPLNNRDPLLLSIM